MKKIILNISIVALFSGYALANSDIEQAAEQFSTRGWSYHSAVFSRKSHLVSYSDDTLIQKAIEKYALLREEINGVESTVSDFSIFYPELKLESSGDIVTSTNSIDEITQTYNLLLNWTDFLNAIGEDSWNDKDTANCTGLVKTGCGRKSLANYALANMTSFQRENLESFKDIILDEINLINSEKLDLPFNSEAIRAFQFLFHERALYTLSDSRYFEFSENKDINKIDLTRALIIQAFQGGNGTIEDSDFKTIDLDAEVCALDVICKTKYFQNLIYTGSNPVVTKQIVSDLIFDNKFVVPFAESFLSEQKHKGNERIDFEGLDIAQDRLSKFLNVAYGVNETTVKKVESDLNFFKLQVRNISAYLIRKSEILGLQVSKRVLAILKSLEVVVI